MQWPARGMNSVGFLPYGGISVHTQNIRRPGFVAATGGVFSKTASYPDGYGYSAAVMPLTAGGMSSWQVSIVVAGGADMLSGGPMDGTAAIAFIGDGNAALIISLSGDGSASFSGDGSVSLTIGMAGNGDWSFSGLGGMSMIVPIEGAGSWAMVGLGDAKGRLDMSGSWSPYTELSPQSLASAVWSALAAQNNEAGSMGDLLNAAGGGGISGAVIDQIVDAVWERTGSNGIEYGATLTSAEKWAKLSAALSA